ncbi:hypothetical protein GOP47_0028708 [Adiantum capillus-veneris]|nr:hypothetical protein GOP47_0028708 [Adiantum capillus-veneris]
MPGTRGACVLLLLKTSRGLICSPTKHEFSDQNPCSKLACLIASKSSPINEISFPLSANTHRAALECPILSHTEKKTIHTLSVMAVRDDQLSCELAAPIS